ncbi:PIN domain-containing protein [uncultured Endozoicomonas sp.]|uniref:PIN domain-containing protein n=1 Tax=uncultured Endozoicomonas sp. TaxID=432652 RepID=UPI00262A2144|nr:PIN domain-containing protein [uncultured Endozoicomonas sp.]
MIETLFLDADIILDLLAQRQPWFKDSATVFQKIQAGDFQGVTSVTIFANVFYILRKQLGHKDARQALVKLKSLLKIMVTSEASLEQALNSSFKDFEDAIQYYTAQNGGASLLLTRNIKDYKSEKLPVMTPAQFLESLNCH